MGAKDTMMAERYFKKLMKLTLLFSIAWNVLIFTATPILMHFYSVADETKQMVISLVLVHNIFSAIAFPFADPLGKGLRATGDVKFTTIISLGTTIGIRLVFSVLFGIVMNLGVVGIAYAMCLDWVLRGIIFLYRFKQNKWKQCNVI